MLTLQQLADLLRMAKSSPQYLRHGTTASIIAIRALEREIENHPDTLRAIKLLKRKDDAA